MSLILKMIIASIVMLGMNTVSNVGTTTVKNTKHMPTTTTQKSYDGLTVILERIYVDGEVSEEQIHKPYALRQQLLKKYKYWTLVEQDDEQLVFQKESKDLSPLMKSNGYLGLSSNGVLSIFNGKPKNEEIIQSFFQIDMNRLESNMHKELLQGIPVRDVQTYHKVLAAFEKYSNEKMKQ